MRISDWSSDVCSSDLKYWRYSRCLWGLRRRTIRRRNDRGFIYAPGLSAARDRLSLDRAFLGPVGGAGLRLHIPRRAGWRAGTASLRQTRLSPRHVDPVLGSSDRGAAILVSDCPQPSTLVPERTVPKPHTGNTPG